LSKVSGFALLIFLPEGAWTGRIRKKAYVNTPLRMVSRKFSAACAHYAFCVVVGAYCIRP
jgi:hypothetical protein